MHDLPVVLIMLLGVAEAAAKMLGVLPAVSPAEVLLLVPTVLTARLPGEVFFTGTTTLLHKKNTHAIFLIHMRTSKLYLQTGEILLNRNSKS